ncbi:MAG: BamA/TamA family outer membrane protein [Victivallales bacterium]|nr:BamA/TamA family outer membrane protein [Victivallales bacterium]
MTTNVSKMFKFRDAVSGNGKLLIAVAIVIFAILPVNAQMSIGEAKQQMKTAEAAYKAAAKALFKAEDVVKDAAGDVVDADKTLVVLKQDKAELERTLATSLKENAPSIQSKIEAVAKKIEKAEAAKAAVAAKLKEAQAAYAKVQAEVGTAQKNWKAATEALHAAELSDPVNKAKAAVATAKDNAAAIAKKLDIADDTVGAAKKELSKTQDIAAAAVKKLKAVEEDITSLNEKLAKTAPEKANVLKAKLAESNKLKTQLLATKGEVEKAVKDATDKLAAAINQRKDVENELAAAKADVATAEQNLKNAKSGKPAVVVAAAPVKKAEAPAVAKAEPAAKTQATPAKKEAPKKEAAKAAPISAEKQALLDKKIRLAEEKKQLLLSLGRNGEAAKVDEEIKALKAGAPAAPAAEVKKEAPKAVAAAPAAAPAAEVKKEEPKAAAAPAAEVKKEEPKAAVAAPAAPIINAVAAPAAPIINKVKENEAPKADPKAEAKAKKEAEKAAKLQAEKDAKAKKEADKLAKAKAKAEAKAAAEAKKNEPVVMPWTPEPQQQLPMLKGDQRLTVPEAKTASIIEDSAVLPQFDIAMVSGDTAIVEKLPVWQAWKEYVEFNKITPKDINEFHGKLIKALQEKGYVFAQVEFPTKIWSTGIFLAKVDCGQLGDITVKNQKHYSAKQIVRALENKEGRFNYAEIHSDLFDLNTKPDLKLQTSLKPVQQGGRRVINAEIEVEDKMPIHGAIELTNSAAKDARNDWRVRSTLQHLNITKHNDSLTLDWLTTGNIGEDMNSLSASYFLPINDALSLNVYGGWNSSFNEDVLPEISARGRGAFAGLQFSYIFYETLRDRFQLSLGWFYQRLTNYQDINGMRYDNGDITLSMPTITLGYTQKVFDNYQGRNFASITLQQNRAGTFGASSKSDFIRASAVDGDFTLAKIQLARFQRLFEGKDAPGKWTLFMKADAQIASDRMPSATRDYIGGRNSVRGYEESELNGDHSFVGTLELRTPLIENFIPGLKKDEQYLKDHPEYWSQHRLQFILFTDFGYVAYDEKDKPDDDNSMWSVGAGIRLGLTKYSQMALDYGYPILKASDDTPDAGRLHLSVQLQF